MNDIIPQDFVMADGGQVLTDSRTVAFKFGKDHKDVLKTIRSLLKKLPDSAKRNFALCLENSDLSLRRFILDDLAESTCQRPRCGDVSRRLVEATRPMRLGDNR